MAIRLQGFAGEIPRQEPFYLPDTAAAYAVNAAMRGGSLTPFRQPAAATTFSADRQGIYLHGTQWLGWNHPVDVVPGPVAQDRLYITHATGQPSMQVGTTEVPLRLAPPGTSPSLTLQGTIDPENAEQVAYAYTWVTSLGEETAPSPLSNVLLWSPGTQVVVGGLLTTPPLTGRYVTGKRIYRAVTGTSGATDLYYVTEVAVSAASYTHDLVMTPISEALTTKGFDPVPENMRGITAMPGGMMAGFAGKELYFSEPYQPHAWPSAYMQALNDTIIGIAAFGTTLAVLTTGQPYIVQGMHPEQMAMQKMEQPFPCVAKLGIVDMGYSAVYPSTDGLVMVSEQGAQLLTANLWTREQWQAMRPTTMRAGRIGHYYGFTFTPATGPAQMILIDPAQPGAGVLRSDDVALSIYTHVESGQTYLLGTDRRTVRVFDAQTAAKKTYVWRSKPYRLPVPVALGAIRVNTDGAAGEIVTARVYAGGVLIRELDRANSDERLPVSLSQDWQVELTGNATVISVAMARTLVELSG